MIYEVGTTLQPRVRADGSILTGYGIIIKVLPTHKGILCRPEMYGLTEEDFAEGVSYEVITDFGNRLVLLPNELRECYTLGDVEDVQSRLDRQIELIQGYYNELVWLDEN